ncbi:MAG: protein phosphatase 2C domain-containing protein [Spirochaetales bacterium]
MKLQVNAVSHVGYQRDRNEDYMFTGVRTLRDDETFHEIEVNTEIPLFFAVADGLGGAAAGEVASKLAVEIFQKGLSNLSKDVTPKEIEALFHSLTQETQKRLQELGERNPNFYGLGTTLTGVLSHRGGWYWVHVGDTRLYRLRDNQLTQVSRDHTLRELASDARIPPHILANCFGGGSEDVYCDVGTLPSLQPHRDALLLTSDGLHDHVPRSDIEKVLVEHSDNPIPYLLKLGLEAGGVDNISCLYIKVME